MSPRLFDIDLSELLAHNMPLPPLVQIALDCSVGEPERFISYAGVIALANRWTAFSVRWGELLDEYQLPYLRTSEAMRFDGVFASWPGIWRDAREERREQLLSRCAQLIRDADMRPIGIVTDIALLPSQKQRAARKKKIFDGVVDQVLSFQFKDLPSEPNIAFICDREQDLHPNFLEWIDRLHRQGNPAYHRITGLCFMNSRAVASVQAADLIAYVMRAYTEASAEHRSVSPLIARLMMLLGDGAAPFVTQSVPDRLAGAVPELSLWEIVQELKRGGGAAPEEER